MDAKYDVDALRAVLQNHPQRELARQVLAVLDDLATLQHENESWMLIEEQNHRDLKRCRQALKRLAEMDYACDDKECAASDVANEALAPSKP